VRTLDDAMEAGLIFGELAIDDATDAELAEAERLSP
jgi:hypothetical protein